MMMNGPAKSQKSFQRINIANNKRTTQVNSSTACCRSQRRESKDESWTYYSRWFYHRRIWRFRDSLRTICMKAIRQYSTAPKECAVDWKEAVCSWIWATHNVDIEELKEVSSQFQLTKQFGRECYPPSAYLVMKYLEEIAKTYQVAWEPSDSGEIRNIYFLLKIWSND